MKSIRSNRSWLAYSLAGFTLAGVTTTACAVPDASTTPTAASAQPPVKTDATSPQASPAKAASSTQAPAPSGLAKPQPTVELAPIIVTGEAPAYVVQDSTTATRLDTPNRDIPRDIVVIPREVIDDRAVVRADELADNVAGVTASTGYGGLSTAEYFLRGFQSQSTYRDGFRDFAFLTPIDLAGTQSVEFLKGPAAALYGLNQPGGIVNILSKRPLDTPYYESEFQVGSYDFYRGSFDVSGPLVYQNAQSGNAEPPWTGGAAGSESLLSYRINAAFEDAGSYRDFNHDKSEFASPSITWHIDQQTSLWVFGDYQHYSYVFDRGLPPIPQTFQLPISRFLGTPNDFDHDNAMRGGFEFNHHFDENWQIRAAFAEIRSEQHSNFVQGFTLEADGQTLDRDETARHEASKNLTAQVELSGKFSTGPIEHHVLLGVEPSQYQFRYDIGDLPFAPINIFNPDYSPQLTDIPYAPRNTYGAEILGVYLMDQVTLLPNLKMLVAGRYDYVDTVEDYNPAPIMNHVNEALSPNVGLVYQPWEPISLYGSWATAFNPNFGLSRTGEHFAPERSQQIEAGIKGEFFNKRLSTTTAVYQIDKQNVLATDPTDPDFEILAGKVRSQGLEEDLIGQPIDGLRIIGSYAHTDAHVKADSTIPVGDHLAGIPAEQLGLWTSYQIQSGTLKGLGVGFGAYYLSSVQATLPNNGVTLPNYWRLDSSLFYQRDHWKAQLNFKNMTDKTYYASQGYEITPQPPFTVIFSLSTKF